MIYKFVWDDTKSTIVEIDEEDIYKITKLKIEFKNMLSKLWKAGEKTNADDEEWYNFLRKKGYTLKFQDEPDYEIFF
jgi:hypothetical protein